MSAQKPGDGGAGWSSYIRPLVRNSHFRMVSTLSTVKEWAGSSASIASVAGSMQNLLDSTKMMSMQEDARTHKISSEVMKHSLYKSVAGADRRHSRGRIPSSRTWSEADPASAYAPDSGDGMDGSWYPRYYQSLPPTPLMSGRATPNSRSPTRKFSFRFLSRGTTPRATSPTRTIVEEDEDEGCRGLASILKPRPRIIRANNGSYEGDFDGLAGGLAT